MMDEIITNTKEKSYCQIIIQAHIGYISDKTTTGYPLLYRIRQAVERVIKEESKKDGIDYEIIRWKDDNFKMEEEIDFEGDI